MCTRLSEMITAQEMEERLREESNKRRREKSGEEVEGGSSSSFREMHAEIQRNLRQTEAEQIAADLAECGSDMDEVRRRNELSIDKNRSEPFCFSQDEEGVERGGEEGGDEGGPF